MKCGAGRSEESAPGLTVGHIPEGNTSRQPAETPFSTYSGFGRGVSEDRNILYVSWAYPYPEAKLQKEPTETPSSSYSGFGYGMIWKIGIFRLPLRHIQVNAQKLHLSHSQTLAEIYQQIRTLFIWCIS